MHSSPPIPQLLTIHAHTREQNAMSKLWNCSEEICQCKNPPECAGYPPLPERAGVRAIPAPAPFIGSLFTEVMISHRKYNDLLTPSRLFSAQAAHICVHWLARGLQMSPC